MDKIKKFIVKHIITVSIIHVILSIITCVILGTYNHWWYLLFIASFGVVFLLWDMKLYMEFKTLNTYSQRKKWFKRRMVPEIY